MRHTHEGLLRLDNIAFNHLGGIENETLGVERVVGEVDGLLMLMD